MRPIPAVSVHWRVETEVTMSRRTYGVAVVLALCVAGCASDAADAPRAEPSTTAPEHAPAASAAPVPTPTAAPTSAAGETGATPAASARAVAVPLDAEDDAPVPGADSTETVELRAAPAAGASVEFDVTRRTEYPGDPTVDVSYSELRTRATLTCVAVDATGATVDVRFGRVHGEVQDGNGRLAFDTAGEVPHVACRLDDVEPFLDAADVTVRVVLLRDGRMRLRSMLGPDGKPKPSFGVLPFLQQLLAVDVIRPGPCRVGDDWPTVRDGMESAPGAQLDSRVHVAGIEADAVHLRCRTVEAGADAGSFTGSVREVVALARTDGLPLHRTLTSRLTHHGDVFQVQALRIERVGTQGRAR